MSDKLPEDPNELIRYFETDIWDASKDEEQDESALLAAIEERVTELLKADPDLLMSYLYRLDIPQETVEYALYHSEQLTPQQPLDHVILERQKVRLKTKRSYPQNPIEGWDSF